MFTKENSFRTHFWWWIRIWLKKCSNSTPNPSALALNEHFLAFFIFFHLLWPFKGARLGTDRHWLNMYVERLFRMHISVCIELKPVYFIIWGPVSSIIMRKLRLLFIFNGNLMKKKFHFTTNIELGFLVYHDGCCCCCCWCCCCCYAAAVAIVVIVVVIFTKI